jgi:hypothetical protein
MYVMGTNKQLITGIPEIVQTNFSGRKARNKERKNILAPRFESKFNMATDLFLFQLQ